MSLVLSLNIFHTLFSISVINFQNVIAGWDDTFQVENSVIPISVE